MPRRREIATKEWVFENHIPDAIYPNPLNDTIRDCVEQLDEEDRDVVLAFFYERKTYSEIAASLGLAGRTSGHYRVNRALDKLRSLLAEHDITDELWEAQ